MMVSIVIAIMVASMIAVVFPTALLHVIATIVLVPGRRNPAIARAACLHVMALAPDVVVSAPVPVTGRPLIARARRGYHFVARRWRGNPNFNVRIGLADDRGPQQRGGDQAAHDCMTSLHDYS